MVEEAAAADTPVEVEVRMMLFYRALEVEALRRESIAML